MGALNHRSGSRSTARRFGIVLLVSLIVAACSQILAPISAGATATATAIVPGVATASPVQAPATMAPTPAAPPTASGPATLARLIGQKLVVRMDGTTPSADLLGRIRRGEVGGVILLGSNITTKTALTAITRQLRWAAVAGGQPRLLIGIDQEGGSVRRISWAPPTMSAPQIGRTGLTSVARAQGANTGASLRGLGIDIDFAPVADVPTSTASFMYLDGRTFSFSASRTAALADAFASGLVSKSEAPAMKHFPGIGFATRNTDKYMVTIRATRAALTPGLLPYRTAIAHHIPMIMLSNATYPAYDPVNGAGWSHAIAVTLLRHDLGFSGVTITDSLNGTAYARGVSPGLLAVRAVKAGTDMILLTGSEASTREVYDTLLREASAGSFATTSLRASYDRIMALKARF